MRSLIVVMLLLAGSLTACTTSHPATQPPLRDADVYPNAQSIAGLTVAVDEITNPDRARHYFGIDLTKDDILPVNIIVSNHGDDRFVIKPSDILLTEGNDVIDPVPIERIQKLIGDRSRPIENIALHETVIPPLGNYQGIQFFKVKKADAGLYGKVEQIFTSGLSMRIVATDQDSGERIHFGPFSLSGF